MSRASLRIRRVKNPQLLSDFANEQAGKPCWLCQSRPWTDLAHLVGGAGRSDERCNLLVLCRECHERNHFCGGARRIHLGHLLFLKHARDPDYYDLARVLALRGWAGLRDDLAIAPPEGYRE